MKLDNSYRYPCTRNIGMDGFGQYLESEIREPRRNIRLFSKELSDCITERKEDISKHITLVNSGSSANLVAALTLSEKLKNEGKPLTAVASAFTFPTTMSALLLAGFEVELIDVDKEGFNISMELLEKLQTPPSLVAVTHFLGFPADMGRLEQYRQKTGCLILQDACETLVCHCNDRPVYSYGDIVTWSFYHPHHLSSYGGGAVYAATQEDFILCDSIAHWGRACKCHIDESLCTIPSGPAHQFTYERLGVNVEMSELNACFGRWQLLKWEEIEEQRRRNYDQLYSQLASKDNIRVWNFFNAQKDSPFVFPILHRDKTVKEVWEIMKAHGIEVRTLMGGATSTQKAFMNHLPANTSCPNAEYMSDHAFFIGCHNTITESDIEYISSMLKEI